MTRELARWYVAITAATAVGMALGAAGVELIDVSTPRDVLLAAPSTALTLVKLNAVIALWPLGLIAVGWHRMPIAGGIGDALVRAQIAGNGLVVGDALGQRPELWRYLPHLPLEWLAVALPVATWATARRGDLGRRSMLIAATATLALLTVSAAAETYLVPIT